MAVDDPATALCVMMEGILFDKTHEGMHSSQKTLPEFQLPGSLLPDTALRKMSLTVGVSS